MRYVWDPEKARSNARKHGVHFADAAFALEDDWALTIEDESSDERRWVTLGLDLFGRLLVVAYTYRYDEIRIFSARKASPKERRQYGKAHEEIL
ncbi:MAG: BrnT family toxin [Candidatus Aminicenantes bacterium]|nr:BrnT family toxin [Candidatus Aminicenantes bacterium]